MKPKSPYEHENLADDDDILSDGSTRRVPMMMRDSVEREVIFVGLADGASLHRPGQRLVADRAARARVEQAYRDSVEELQAAWRQPVADVAGEFQGAREGDACTVREGGRAEGSPGHLQMVSGKLTCVPDERRDAVPRTMTADAAQKIRDRAWEESVRADENAWRKPAR